MTEERIGTVGDPGLEWQPPALDRPGAARRLTDAVTRGARLGNRSPVRDLAPAIRWALLWYLASRVLVLAIAALDGYVRHHSFVHELSNWDGFWYVQLAVHGYPSHLAQTQTPLGFFPLYPLAVRGLAQVVGQFGLPGELHWRVSLVGVMVSQVGGLAAAIVVQRLATGWWGERAGRRAVAFFCLFPGSIVFSMVYAEGLMLPLVAGCILALERRRWLIAGSLAALATATEPQGLVIVLVCLVSAGRHIRRTGWSTDAVRSLAAPALSLTGAAAVASYLWLHTGTPFATLITQHGPWHERFDLLALVHQERALTSELSHPVAGVSVYHPLGALVGAVVLAVSLAVLVLRRWTLSPEAWVWTVGIIFIALTSEQIGPNARMLITAFPAVLVLAASVKGRAFWLLQGLNALVLVASSWLTFIGHRLPP